MELFTSAILESVEQQTQLIDKVNATTDLLGLTYSLHSNE